MRLRRQGREEWRQEWIEIDEVFEDLWVEAGMLRSRRDVALDECPSGTSNLEGSPKIEEVSGEIKNAEHGDAPGSSPRSQPGLRSGLTQSPNPDTHRNTVATWCTHDGTARDAINSWCNAVEAPGSAFDNERPRMPPLRDDLEVSSKEQCR